MVKRTKIDKKSQKLDKWVDKWFGKSEETLKTLDNTKKIEDNPISKEIDTSIPLLIEPKIEIGDKPNKRKKTTKKVKDSNNDKKERKGESLDNKKSETLKYDKNSAIESEYSRRYS